jgi:hypothetical protein
VIVFIVVVLVGPTKIVQPSHEYGFWFIAFLVPTEIL